MVEWRVEWHSIDYDVGLHVYLLIIILAVLFFVDRLLSCAFFGWVDNFALILSKCNIIFAR